jgi:RimJ/RimL family protein N-acetyltransferase
MLIELPEVLVGDRVRVRPYRKGDGPALEEAVSSSLEHLKPWMPWANKPQSSEDFEELARTFAAKWILREDLGVGIWPLDESRLLGGSGLHRIDWEVRKFEIGYWIRPEEEGKGLVSETARLLCGLAFDRLGANRVFIRCSTNNARSAAVPKRLGFVHEGTLYRDHILPGGQIDDMHVFGMTRELWEETGQRRSQ